MPKPCCAFLVLLAIVTAVPVHASSEDSGEKSLSIGVSSANLNLIDDADISGLSATYNYTPSGQRIGFSGSATFASGSDTISQPYGPSATLDSTYLSFLLGPSYQFSTHVRGYGLVGAAYGQADLDPDFSSHEITIAYGAGVQITDIGRFLVDLHWEGVGVDGGDRHLDGQIYSLGIGYHF